MTNRNKDFIFVSLFTFLVCAIFREILFLKETFIKGDYLQQFYPWFSVYSESLKNLTLPLWVNGVECGFPLFAEGQIGPLYPLNLVFFYLLPFEFAYNFSFIFHMILAGVFTYFYSRKLNIDVWGSAISSVLISFGGVYAGAFINISALKCLAWFPAVLLIYEIYSLDSKDNKRHIFLIGLILGIQFLSGSIQMAAYSALFYSLYILYKNKLTGGNWIKALVKILIIAVIALAISSPQLLATLRLSLYSNRALATPDFSLWNSFSPLSLTGALMPYMGMFFSKGNIFYIGVLGLFFAIIALIGNGRDKAIKPLIAMTVISLFFALGKYNPLYVLLLKASGMYSFRAPSRFIYFTTFFMAVLSGAGFSLFFGDRDRKEYIWPALRIFYIFSMVIGVSFLAANAVIRLFGSSILDTAKIYVSEHIYNQPFHRYDMDFYISKAEGIYKSFVERISPANTDMSLSLVILIAGIFLVLALSKNIFKKRVGRYVSLAFIALELAIFSMYSKGIKPDLAPFDYAKVTEGNIAESIKSDKDTSRILVFGKHSDIPLWLKPSMNIINNIDSVGLYTPLVDGKYFDYTKGLGVVDDSMGIITPDKNVLYNKINLLRILNVKYVLSAEVLDNPSLKPIRKENNINLYGLDGFMPRFVFSRDLASWRDGTAVKAEKYSSGYAKINLDAKEDGYLVFSERNYPGWEVKVNGSEARVEDFYGILMSVKVNHGVNNIVFRYGDVWVSSLIILSVAVYLLIAAGFTLKR